jgi:hypothetical protein
LQEKFSTALYARKDQDPFAQAAVRDAEATAEQVQLQKKFPIAFPRPAYTTIALIICAALTAWLMKPMDLFGKEAERKRIIDEQAKVEETKKIVMDAIAKVEMMPKAVVDEEAIKLAKRDLEAMLIQPTGDRDLAHRTAMKALQDIDKAVAEKIRNSQRYANAQNDAKMYKSMSVPINDQGPVADAHRAIAKGDFSNAMNKVEEAVKKFDQMDEKEKQKAAEQMKNLAQQLDQAANDPQKKEQMEKQLQQLAGGNQQQAQQMMKQMQQAAAGDKQAQQQLQQQAQQMMQQMNNGQGPTPQQQQQINQMMQQMQAQANGQQQAQQMAQAAQQMAQAMQQAAQGQQGQGQQGQGQQGQGQQGAGQQMAQAQQAMQDQLQQMQAAQQDAAQIAAAQQAAQQAAQDAANAANGNCPHGNKAGECGACNGQGQGQGQGAQGQWAAGDPANKQGNGMGGPGQGAGGVAPKEVAPGAFKQEVSPVQDIESGKILASTYVKADSLKGESKVEFGEVLEAAQKESTDEVDQDRISRQAQGVVQEYFKTMEDDLK